MPATGVLIGTPASMRRDSRRRRGHRRRTVRRHDLGRDADRVGEIIFARMTARSERSASAPWPISRRFSPPTRPFHPPKGREVVVADEPLADFAAGVAVEVLRFVARRERGQAERLGLAAREERGTVRARQQADFARERADFGGAASVAALLLVEDRGAEKRLDLTWSKAELMS